MKTFTVTIINNQTIAVDIQAASENEARKIVESSEFNDLVRANPARLIDCEFSIDDITEN